MSYIAAKTAEELLSFLDKALEHFGPTDIWWRGQACSEWPLQPGVCRRPDADIIEQDFVNRFRRKALSRHHNCPPLYDNTAWLFLMQHYCLPTRLLDWSESILIATYFAVNDQFSKPGAIWALSPFALNENEFGNRCIFEPDGATIHPLIEHAFKKTAQRISRVGAISTKEIDPRMMVQLSVFTIHGCCEPLDLRTDHEKYLMKFEIPSESKKKILQLLYDLGVRESNIFPDLEHLALDMGTGEYKNI
jgi:hypothetical protein